MLTVECLIRGQKELRSVDAISLRAPLLQPVTWVSHVVWTIDLPADQHLFDYPREAAPMYRWERRGLIWGRTPLQDRSTLEQWIGSPAPPTTTIDVPGNIYSFSQFGAPTELRIRSMSTSLVLLFGAGLSLGVGFVLMRVQVARHVLSLLGLAVLLAVAALWYLPLLELLLQPIIAGLIFPLCAVLIQRWHRMPTNSTVLTLGTDPAMGYLDPSANGRSGLSNPPYNPEELTQLRQPQTDSEAMRYETGSGVS